MQRAPTPSLLLEVWREVCRHIDIDESLARIAPILAQTLPVTRVLVRRVAREAQRLVTIAEGSVAKGPAAPAAARSDLDGAALALVAGWLKLDQVQSWRAGESRCHRTNPEAGGTRQILQSAVCSGSTHDTHRTSRSSLRGSSRTL